MSESKENVPRVGGITSVFEKSIAAETPKAESAVSNIASRFESAGSIIKPPSATGVVSSKISSIAGAFEPAAANKAVTKPSSFLPKSSPKKADAISEPVVEPARPLVSDVAAIFATGKASSKELSSPSGQFVPSAFKKASSAFEQRVKVSIEPTETKVSSFARQFDKAVKSGDSVDITRKSASVEQESNDASDLPNRFKSATSLFEGTSTPESGDTNAESSNRFKEATKLFGGSRS